MESSEQIMGTASPRSSAMSSTSLRLRDKSSAVLSEIYYPNNDVSSSRRQAKSKQSPARRRIGALYHAHAHHLVTQPSNSNNNKPNLLSADSPYHCDPRPPPSSSVAAATAATGASLKHRQRAKSSRWIVKAASILASLISLQLAVQSVNHVLDLRRRDVKHARPHDMFSLGFEIPLQDIPPLNWPIWLRLFRPNNRRLVTEARDAITEYGHELRSLLGGDLAKEYLMPRVISRTERARSRPTQNFNSTEALLFRKRLGARALWLRGDSNRPTWPLSELPEPIKGQAVIISAGDKQFYYLETLIHTIRVIHHSRIPIRVVFRDATDLTEPSKTKIIDSLSQPELIGDIQFIDLSTYFDLDSSDLRGWNLKAFGILAVAETEVALLDADVLLLQPPEDLFQAKDYKQTGALFFHDRIKPQFYWDVHTYATWLQPKLASSPKLNQLFRFGGGVYTEQVQEAGVLLIDKERRMLGVWAACLIFGRVDIRKYIQTDHMYGDKEVYWTAFEAIEEPYAFARFFPGVLGGTLTDFKTNQKLPIHATVAEYESMKVKAVASGQSLCGRLLHFDDVGLPLWSNGGYMLKEDDWTSTLDISDAGINPVWFIDGGDSQTEEFVNPWLATIRSIIGMGLYRMLQGQNQVWALHAGLGSECLSQNSRFIRNVPDDSAKHARKAVQHCFKAKVSHVQLRTNNNRIGS